MRRCYDECLHNSPLISRSEVLRPCCRRQSNFAPLDREQLEKHLLGNEVIGLYPMTINDTCCLLAIDFDKSTWREDITAIRGVCAKHDIPMYVERSRSGDGAHLWFFFDNEIKAAIVRKFGMCILEQAMQANGIKTGILSC